MPTALQLKAMWIKFHSVPYNPLIPNSPYSLPNDSHYVGLDNSVPDQLVISSLIFFLIHITCLHDIV